MTDDAAGAELARQHYWIAEMTAKEGLPVDWHFVAVRMAQALAGLPEATLGAGQRAASKPGGDVLWPHQEEHADASFPVGADQGAPRLHPGEER